MKFQRHEKKYLTDKRTAARLAAALAPYFAPDEYADYTICSVYFDTPDFAALRRGEGKPAYKEKLRLRSYGVPADGDTVYLELKKKLDGVTYKRRMALTQREAKAYLQAGIRPAETGQVFREIDWFLRQNRPEAKAVICYDRKAFHAKDDPDLRLTFDENIRFRKEDLSLALGDAGRLLLPRGQVMAEIKIPGAMPLYLAETLSALALYPMSFSKFGNACGKTLEKDVRSYA